jgi:hypothetical protein
VSPNSSTKPDAGKASPGGAAHAWKQHAPALAAWADKHLVNRRTSWGGYWTDKAGKVRLTTRKAVGEGKQRSYGPLTLTILQDHFASAAMRSRVGLHTTFRDDAGQCWCLWGVVDIDRHGEGGDPEANERYALALYEKARALGLVVLLFDSNGAGGFHLWVLFAQPVPTRRVFTFLRWLTGGWKGAGLSNEPECFPKQPGIGPDEYGNWVRLPGPHHKRDHYTRVWSKGEWLEGGAAVKVIVSTVPGPDAIPHEAVAEPERDSAARDHQREQRKGGFTVEAGMSDADLARDALRHLPSSYCDDYDPWFKVGCALRKLDSEGLAIWDEWSKGSPKYEAGACAEKWPTIGMDGVGFGSLITWAEQAGWVNPNKRHQANGRQQTEPGSGAGDPGQTKAAAAPPDPVFANFYESEKAKPEGVPEVIRAPLRMAEIAGRLNGITKGWPKRVGPMLFVEGDDGKPHWLDTCAKLFAWIDRRANVAWTKGTSFITQERFYEDLKTHAERFDAIEVCPHFPPLPRVYYMHPPVSRSAARLEGLIDKFAPASTIDRHLIKAFVLTLLWGGSPGGRPAFLFTGPARDSENGRGLGKSTLPEVLAQEITGGMVEIPPTGDMEAVKTRLLSPGAAFIRVARLDNVKTHRFSWAELEGLITSSVISGKRLYQGEGSRVNTLLWAITVNGESLSEDLAQRCVHVRVKRPRYSPTWKAEVRDYIRADLPGLWADIRYELENRSPDVEPSGRWAEWECGVLASTPDVVETQLELISRRSAMNADRAESDDFRHYVASCLESQGFRHDTCYVFITSQIMCDWLCRSERKQYATNQATARVRGFGIPELTKDRTEARRGWLWKGVKHEGDCEPDEARPSCPDGSPFTVTAEGASRRKS